MKVRTAVVIPAFNEEARIAVVLEAVLAAKLVDEVIVVSDASHDRTVEIARQYGCTVIELRRNEGKGGAMSAGVRATRAPLIGFVDADLIGLKAEHVDAIFEPVLAGDCDMCVGVFRGGRLWSDTAQRIAPYISGQRALKREIVEAIPGLSEVRMGVEVAINTYAKRMNVRVKRTVLRGVSNTSKESKMGLVRGVAARGKMYAEIVRAVRRLNRREKARAVRR